MARKKQKSNAAAWLALGVVALGIYHFGIVGNDGSGRVTGSQPASSSINTSPSSSASEPLSKPRIVNVASLNVRHTPNPSGPLITTLPHGTSLTVLDQDGGWLLVDLGPTLEGWVAERLTTTQAPKPAYLPPAHL